jgi:cytochrome c oxidase subunit I+III
VAITLDRFKKLYSPPAGFGSWFANVNNTALGKRFMLTAFIFFLLGGVMALLMRTQLAVPENTFLDPETYNQLFTMHGSTMMFLFIIPFLEGLAVYIVPLMIGSRDVAFPRLTAFSYWIYLFGGLVFYASFIVDAVPDAGWFAYPPLSGPEYSGLGMNFWLLGLSLVEFAGVATGAELAVTILKMRAPGMALNRMPLFVWAILVTALAIVFAFTVLLIATVLLELEHLAGAVFFNPERGGQPLLWQHLFWIFGHPEVYIMFIPATGIVSTIVPVFAQRRFVGYTLVVLALVVTGFVSFGLWVHHMFTTGLPELSLSFFTATSFIIALASGTQIFAWIATLWGRRPRLDTPLLFVLGFVIIFVLGGVTGVMLAAVPFDWQAHDTFFVVAHFHYVIIGGVVFPILAGLHYWLPKITGRLLNEGLGKLSFWLIFIGFNVTFFPMHMLGLGGMPRRVYTYPDGLGLNAGNLVATIGAYVLALGFLVFVINALQSLRTGKDAGRNPWNADTLEWLVDSPPPPYSFRAPPLVGSRHPLWDPVNRQETEEKLARATEALTAAPGTWRATLVTSVFAAEPQAIQPLSAPTYTPLVTALGLTLFAVGFLSKVYLLSAVGALVGLVALIWWLWPSKHERNMLWESDIPNVAGLPIYTTGGRAIGWWGTVFFIVIAGVMLTTIVFSYFYLRLYSEQWPQGGIEPPALLLPIIAIVFLLLSALPARWAVRQLRRSERGRTGTGLLLASLLGLVFFGVQLYHLLTLPFVIQQNAYASAFYTLSVLLLLLTLIGLGLNLGLQLRLQQDRHVTQTMMATENITLYWYFVVAAGLASFLTLYVSPYL